MYDVSIWRLWEDTDGAETTCIIAIGQVECCGVWWTSGKVHQWWQVMGSTLWRLKPLGECPKCGVAVFPEHLMFRRRLDNNETLNALNTLHSMRQHQLRREYDDEHPTTS